MVDLLEDLPDNADEMPKDMIKQIMDRYGMTEKDVSETVAAFIK